MWDMLSAKVIENVFDYVLSCVFMRSKKQVVDSRPLLVAHRQRLGDPLEPSNLPQSFTEGGGKLLIRNLFRINIPEKVRLCVLISIPAPRIIAPIRIHPCDIGLRNTLSPAMQNSSVDVVDRKVYENVQRLHRSRFLNDAPIQSELVRIEKA